MARHYCFGGALRGLWTWLGDGGFDLGGVGWRWSDVGCIFWFLDVRVRA